MSRQEFLFAVARGVQRNKNLMYSGVFVDCKKFLFAVARGVQRNGDLYESRLKREVFLFAVARGVQRNSPPWPDASMTTCSCFYSLSRGAYSGTLPPPARP